MYIKRKKGEHIHCGKNENFLALPCKINLVFFYRLSVQLYGGTTWTLRKRLEKNLDGKKNKDATCSFEQIMEAAPNKTTAVGPLSSNLVKQIKHGGEVRTNL